MPKHDVFPALTKCFSFQLTRSYADIEPKEKQRNKQQQQNVKMQHKEFYLSVVSGPKYVLKGWCVSFTV